MGISRRIGSVVGAAATVGVLCTFSTAHAQAELTAEPTVVRFPETSVGESSVETVTISNSGTEVADFALEILGDVFEIVETTCSGRLGSNRGCTVGVGFTPDSTGSSYEGALEVAATDGSGSDVVVELRGTSPPTNPTSVPPTTVTSTSTPPPSATSTTSTSLVPPPSIGATTVPDIAGTSVLATTTVAGPTTSTAPGPTTSVADEVFDVDEIRRELAECERRARNAEVEFPTELEMTVGTPIDVVVRASIVGTPRSDVPRSGSDPPTEVAPASLSCLVVASLSGRSFVVEPDSQSGDFLKESSIRWTWSVEAEAAGTQLLRLRIVPRLLTPDGFADGTPVGPFDADIQVNSRPRSNLDRLGDSTQTIVNHPLARSIAPAVGIIGTLAAIWRWILHKPWPWTRSVLGREAEATESDDERSGYL